MTRQTWAAAASALIFVAMAAVLAVTSVPFVSWSPGGTYDIYAESEGDPIIDVSGISTHETSGELRITTVAVTSANGRITFPEALLSYLLPDRQVLPREAVYPAGQSADDIDQENAEAMVSSQQSAIVAALRAAGIGVVEYPMVSVVISGGPAENHLEPGDLITSIDGGEVSSVTELRELIAEHTVGDSVVFEVLRNGEPMSVTLQTQASNTTPTGSVVGVGWVAGYDDDADITLNIDTSIGGPSAGLIFAVGIFDSITSQDLLQDRTVAGTGEIGTDGVVGGIGGIVEKISGAESSGASIFLVPEANCPDIQGVSSSMKLVKVSTLSDAIAALRIAKDSDAELPACDG